MSKDTPHCYCCGRPIGKTFSIVVYKGGNDRGFIVVPEHVECVLDKDNMIEIKVKEVA